MEYAAFRCREDVITYGGPMGSIEFLAAKRVPSCNLVRLGGRCTKMDFGAQKVQGNTD